MSSALIFSPQLLQEQLLLVLEKYFFMFADPLPDSDITTLDGDYLSVQMDFHINKTGLFSMFIPIEIIEELTANFLGIEVNEVEKNDITFSDTAKEIMNIVGGGILSSFPQKIEHFSMGLPRLNRLSKKDEINLAGSHVLAGVLINERPLFLQIITDQ